MKIKYVDMWTNFDQKNNFFHNILQKHYDIELSDDPDIIFCSVFGFEHLNYTCKKIFYIGENIKPDFNYYDYAFSFEDNSDQNFCLPHFVVYKHFFDYSFHRSNSIIDRYQTTAKTKFCSFMATNANAVDRITFVKKLLEYKKVDCSGSVLYNMEKKKNIGRVIDGQYIDWVDEKLETISHYKFTIAFENEREDNYVTEKIFHPLLVNSIPIYWGAPNIDQYFNPKCYINVSDFDSFESAIAEIERIDQDDALYATFFEEPTILPTSKIAGLSEEKIFEKLRKVIESDFVPIGKKNASLNKTLYDIKYKEVLELEKKHKSFIRKIYRFLKKTIKKFITTNT